MSLYLNGVCIIVYQNYLSHSRYASFQVKISDSTLNAIGMLLTYYLVDEDGKITQTTSAMVDTSKFVPLKFYKTHIPPPSNIVEMVYNVDLVVKLSEIIQLNPTDENMFSIEFKNIEKFVEEAKSTEVQTKRKRKDTKEEEEEATSNKIKKAPKKRTKKPKLDDSEPPVVRRRSLRLSKKE